MRDNLKKMFSYYKPYMNVFIADMFFAFGAAAVALSIPIIIRYITSTVLYYDDAMAFRKIGRAHV